MPCSFSGIKYPEKNKRMLFEKDGIFWGNKPQIAARIGRKELFL